MPRYVPDNKLPAHTHTHPHSIKYGTFSVKSSKLYITYHNMTQLSHRNNTSVCNSENTKETKRISVLTELDVEQLRWCVQQLCR